MSNILITGVAGFIGSNFVRMMLKQRPDVNIVGLDSLTYAGNLHNLADCLDHPNFRFCRGDICNTDEIAPLFADGLHAIVNFAAESHVDRSIHGAQAFVQTNIAGTQVLLDLARTNNVERFLQISTDEVYGSLGATGLFTEDTPISPNSPYSASKASADMLVMAAHETFGLNVVITRCSNNYGPYQFPEKLIPLFVTNLAAGKKVPLYGDGMNVRDWIHVEDHCDAILLVLEKGESGRAYNIGGDCELPNIEIAKRILSHMGKDESDIKYVTDRPGHDQRYAIDFSRLNKELGWSPKVNFDSGIADTIDWYLQNEDWWQQIKTGAYLTYYEKQYGPGGIVGAKS